MSCVVKGLNSSAKADDFPVCTAQCTSSHTRYPKNREQLVSIYLAKCKLVNALSHMSPVEEMSGTWLSGLVFGLHRILVMHSRGRNSVCVEIFYCTLSDLWTHVFQQYRIYMHVYMCIL